MKFFKYKQGGKNTYINLEKLKAVRIESFIDGSVLMKADKEWVTIMLTASELTRLVAQLEGDL